MSPVNDTFLTGSLDKTVRLWDLKSPNCQVTVHHRHGDIVYNNQLQGIMHLSGRPVASFDPEGLIFAVGIESKLVKLYDLRSFDKVNIVTIFTQFLPF